MQAIDQHNYIPTERRCFVLTYTANCNLSYSAGQNYEQFATLRFCKTFQTIVYMDKQAYSYKFHNTCVFS